MDDVTAIALCDLFLLVLSCAPHVRLFFLFVSFVWRALFPPFLSRVPPSRCALSVVLLVAACAPLRRLGTRFPALAAAADRLLQLLKI